MTTMSSPVEPRNTPVGNPSDSPEVNRPGPSREMTRHFPAKIFASEGRKQMDMSPTYQESITQPPPADWTIMLYIEADGALANFAVESLKQLHESASAPSAQKDNEANVVVAAHFSFSGDA